MTVDILTMVSRVKKCWTRIW